MLCSCNLDAQYYFVGLEKNGPHVRLPRTAQCKECSVPGEEQGVQTYYSLTLIVFASVFQFELLKVFSRCTSSNTIFDRYHIGLISVAV